MVNYPPLLRELFEGIDNRSKHFIRYVWNYNLSFQFVSLVHNSRLAVLTGGPPVLKLQGFPYHRINNVGQTTNRKLTNWTVVTHP
jgi:hypothetical protein